MAGDSCNGVNLEGVSLPWQLSEMLPDGRAGRTLALETIAYLLHMLGP